MFGRDYYALVSGFREYALDAETKGFDIEAILAEIGESVSARDMKCVRLLYAYYDCENIVALHNDCTAHNRLGRLSVEESEQEMKSPKLLPERIARVLRAYANPEGEDAEELDMTLSFARALFGAYYDECAASPSRFLREWSEFDRTLRNVIAAATARSQGIPVETVTVGGGEIVEQLQRSSAADFGLRGELPYMDAIIAVVNDEHNMLEKERRIDRIRWDMASELSTFDYFDIDAVLAYLVKVNMVARWSLLDRKYGREMFERLMAELDGSELIRQGIDK